jgi:hypothetical protein
MSPSRALVRRAPASNVSQAGTSGEPGPRP